MGPLDFRTVLTAINKTSFKDSPKEFWLGWGVRGLVACYCYYGNFKLLLNLVRPAGTKNYVLKFKSNLNSKNLKMFENKNKNFKPKKISAIVERSLSKMSKLLKKTGK